MTTDIDRIAAPRAVTSQATAVEQTRAVAEVLATVKVAQEVPRSIARAEAEMRDACGRIAFAERAFYSVKNRGSGSSVHMARELARIFGNVQFGVHELHRDDDAGMSEIQAFAWDVQTNVRSTRTFLVPHVRMRNGKRQPLTDVQDIYLSNQNIGARAVRECIFTVLPAWFTDTAEQLAHETLRRGSDAGQGEVPLGDRVAAMVDAYGKGGVTVEQLEARVGKTLGAWLAEDVAHMGVVFESLKRKETTVADEFPTAEVEGTARVTTEEIAARGGDAE
ncbi:hypothetical protein [Nocardioides sp. SR21]|uniref:hypothetical protein n=1 Tax=Nocardioides sp. SR21 TaxID=2919501 RepID=UPI001FAA8CFC|nr:hypothetical protein [Nocardioides sp. SR21]